MDLQFLLKSTLILVISYPCLAVLIRLVVRLRSRELLKKSKTTGYPVHYVSQRNSHSLLRPIPWDASGTLSSDKDGFHFEGSSLLGRQMEIDIDADQATINYQSGNLLWDAGHSWCVIEVDGEKHYFTSEIELEPTFDSKSDPKEQANANTLGIYQALTKRYIETEH